MNAKVTWCLVSMTLAAGALAATGLPGMVFHPGLYGQDGICTSLRRPVARDPQPCQGRIGVLAQGQDRVSFMFESADGSGTVIFRSLDVPTYRDDNDLAAYPIDNVLDMSNARVYECRGECRIESRTDGVAIQCDTWKQADRENLCASARFMGNGLWMLVPAKTADTRD